MYSKTTIFKKNKNVVANKSTRELYWNNFLKKKKNTWIQKKGENKERIH